MFGKNKNVFIESEVDKQEISTTFAKKEAYKIDEGTYSVTSTIIYGVQWDATMQFFDSNYINGECEQTSYVVDERYGWKKEDGLKKTGTDLKENGKVMNCIKNIYDMAGNAAEETGEDCTDDSYRSLVSFRGMEGKSASSRGYPYETINKGFRITLYL